MSHASTDKAATRAAKRLMIAFRSVAPYTQEESSGASGYIHRARSGRRYYLDSNAMRIVNNTATRLTPMLDYYPVEECVGDLISLLAEECDQRTPLERVHGSLSDGISNLLRDISSQAEWEFIHAVRGIDLEDDQAFTVGPCNFYRMDREEFLRWGQRESSGTYNPFNDQPVLDTWLAQNDCIEGHVVCSVRVTAMNHKHAIAKSSRRIQEAINLLCLWQLFIGSPKGPFPEVGLSSNQWQHECSIGLRLDAPDFSDNQTIGGPVGYRHSLSHSVPARDKCEALLQVEPHDRSDIQNRLIAALQWIREAAFAPNSAIRLVSLVTSLESLLLEETESLGKRAKLSQRMSQLLEDDVLKREIVLDEIGKIYKARSERVHGGILDVENAMIAKTISLVARGIAALLDKQPFSSASNIRDLVNCFEKRAKASTGREQWINCNAYFRYLKSQQGTFRDIDHWFDAEREYICSILFRGKNLDSIAYFSNDSPDSEE